MMKCFWSSNHYEFRLQYAPKFSIKKSELCFYSVPIRLYGDFDVKALSFTNIIGTHNSSFIIILV